MAIRVTSGDTQVVSTTVKPNTIVKSVTVGVPIGPFLSGGSTLVGLFDTDIDSTNPLQDGDILQYSIARNKWLNFDLRAEIDSDNTVLQTQITANDSDIADLRLSDSATSDLITGLQTQINANDADILALLAADSVFDVQIQGNAANISTLFSNVTTLQNFDSNILSRVDSNENILNDYIVNNDSALATEIAARIAGDSDLQVLIDSNATNIVSLQTQITGNDSDIVSLQSQIISNDSDILALQTSVAAGVDSAVVVSIVQPFLDSNAADISTEITNRSNADSDLQAQIDSDGVDINTLFGNLATEITNRSNADSDLQAQIDSDGTDINTLFSNLATETLARISGDSDLQSQIDSDGVDINTLFGNLATEITNRSNADSDLQSQIDSDGTDINTLFGNLATEIVNRSNFDSDLQVQIDSNSGDISVLFGAVDSNATDISSLQTQITNNDSDILALQNAPTGTDSATVLAIVQPLVDSNAADISGLQTQIINNDSDILALQNAPTGTDSATVLAIVQPLVDSNGADINTLFAAVDSNAADISGLQTQIINNDSDILDLQGNQASVIAAGFQGFRAYIDSATTTAVTTRETLVYNNVDYDIDSGYDNTTGEYTVPLAYTGKYMLFFVGHRSANIGDTYLHTQRDTGSGFQDIAAATHGGGGNGISAVSGPYLVSAGDKFRVQIFTGSAEDLEVTNQRNFFSGAVIATAGNSLGFDSGATLALVQPLIDSNATDISSLQTQIINNDSDILALQNAPSGVDSAGILAIVQPLIDSNATDISSLQIQIDSDGADINTLFAAVDSNGADISSLQMQIDSDGADINTLFAAVDSNATDISSLQTQIINNDSDILALQGINILDSSQILAFVTPLVDSNATDINTLFVSVDSNATDINTLFGAVDSNATDINTLFVSVDSNAADIVSLQTQITDNDSDILALQLSGSSVATSDSAPVSPSAGDLWFKTDTLDLFIYYDDGSSQQWVDVFGTGAAAAWTLDSNALYYDGALNVGIGLSNPSEKLEVQGNAIINGTFTVDSSTIRNGGTLTFTDSSTTTFFRAGTDNVARYINLSGSRTIFGYTGNDALVEGGPAKGVSLRVNGGTEALGLDTDLSATFAGAVTVTVDSANWTGNQSLNATGGVVKNIMLTGNTTVADSVSEGDTLVLHVADGDSAAAAYTITWPTITWVSDDGVAPTLQDSVDTVINIWKVASVLYGFAANGA